MKTTTFRFPAASALLLAVGLLVTANGSAAAPFPSAMQEPQTQPPADPQPETAPAPQPDPAPQGETAAPPATEPVDPQSFPAVVAKVNGEEIERKELIGTATGAIQEMQANGQPAPPQTSDFYRQILNRLIGSELIYQESQAQGLTIPAEDVTARVAELEQRTGGGEQLDQMLAQQELTRDELRETLAEDMAIQRYVEEKVAPAVNVSEQEAQSFYDENQQRLERPEQARVSHILIRSDAAAGEEEKKAAREKAEGLRAQLSEGAEFSELATANSEDPGSKENGGDLGWVSRGQTVEPFENAAFALQPGETSEVVESPFGFHIIRLNERRAAGTLPFEEAREQIEAFLKQRKLGEVLNRKVEELEQKAEIERFL